MGLAVCLPTEPAVLEAVFTASCGVVSAPVVDVTCDFVLFKSELSWTVTFSSALCCGCLSAVPAVLDVGRGNATLSVEGLFAASSPKY